MRGLLLALFTLAALPAGAEEQSTDLARRHYQSASAYFEEGRFDEAIREFRESYRLAPRVDLLYNIARCFLKKGDAARTIEAYREYLAANPTAPDRRTIEDTMANLEKQVGRVRIVNAPDGAELLVGGFSIGHAPLPGPVAVTVGACQVEARPTDGSAPRRISVTVAAGAEVEARLPDAVKEVVVREKVITVDTGARWTGSRLGWIGVIGGAAFAIAGGVMLGLARPTQEDANHAATEADWRAGQERAQLLQILGAGGLAVGGALAIAGVVAFALRARSEAPAPTVSAWLSPQGGGLTAGGSF